MISETVNDDFELSEVVVFAEELEPPDELSFSAQGLKYRLKQQQYKIILDIFSLYYHMFYQTKGDTLDERRETEKQRISEKVQRIPASRNA